MHSVQDSANPIRDQRRSETTRTLIRVSRTFTAERGLAGFTIEELCAEAAVSRRTFFNYFASKEDAVLGIPIGHSDAEAVAAFMAKPSPTPGEISPALLADLAELTETRWRDFEVAPETVALLIAAVDKEPRLLGRMIQLGIEAEQADARLIEQREGLREGDPRAELAAQIVGAVSRSALGAFLEPGNADPLAVVFHRRIEATQALFASQTIPIGKPE